MQITISFDSSSSLPADAKLKSTVSSSTLLSEYRITHTNFNEFPDEHWPLD